MVASTVKKATTFQSKNAARRINSCGSNYTATNRCRQKSRRRAPSIFLPSFNFSRVLVITQALIYFHILLVDGSDPNAIQPRELEENNQKRKESSDTVGNPPRFVRREVEFVERLRNNDHFVSGQLFAPTNAPTDDGDDDNIFMMFNSTDDDLMSNSTDDNFFDDNNSTLNMSEVPSASPSDVTDQPTSNPTKNPTFTPTNMPTPGSTEAPTPGPTKAPSPGPTPGPTDSQTALPSTSPSETIFLPVDPLGGSGDPLVDLAVNPTAFPTDGIDGKIDNTTLPSEQPSDGPSLEPSVTPTQQPTANPTFTPTNTPTPGPTPGPTDFPTPVPTPGPTDSPTPGPSPGPTDTPTPGPTPGPTDPPTRVPTASPTPGPTPGPTDDPTPFPTPGPTDSPTHVPTQTPTHLPTPGPTFIPTHFPTANPTPAPSRRPTRFPTIRPTQDPTPSGTLEPSESPKPSASPTISFEPTIYPTGRPSRRPTPAPTLPQQRGEVTGQMELSPLGEQLGGVDQIVWEEVTEVFAKAFFESNEASDLIDSPMVDPRTRANVVTQYKVSRPQVASGTTEEGNSEPPVESLVIQYKITITYHSARESNANELVWAAFNTPEKQDEYILDLQEQSVTYNSIRDIEVAVDGWVPPPTQAPTPEPEKETRNIAVIAGGSVGGLALIILIVLFVFRRRGKSVAEKEIAGTQATPATPKNIKVSTEILVEPQDDVSTLGDPMYGQGGMMMGGMDRDEMTAT